MEKITAPKKSNLARKYRDKHGMEMPTIKLARIMYAENKLLFRDIDDARWTLRYIEGKSGKNKWGVSKEPKYFIKEERLKNPYNLPDSDEESYEPYIIKGHKRVGVIND